MRYLCVYGFLGLLGFSIRFGIFLMTVRVFVCIIRACVVFLEMMRRASVVYCRDACFVETFLSDWPIPIFVGTIPGIIEIMQMVMVS